MTDDVIALYDGRVLEVHGPNACAGTNCSIHNPSEHPLSTAPLNWRSDRRLMERMCEHGIGHPDPDHMTWYAGCHTDRETWAEGIHGCDGCCAGDFDAVQST